MPVTIHTDVYQTAPLLYESIDLRGTLEIVQPIILATITNTFTCHTYYVTVVRSYPAYVTLLPIIPYHIPTEVNFYQVIPALLTNP